MVYNYNREKHAFDQRWTYLHKAYSHAGMSETAIQINNITYVVQREFVGEKTPSDLIRERIRQAHCQSLPLTTPASHVYNSGESTSTTRYAK